MVGGRELRAQRSVNCDELARVENPAILWQRNDEPSRAMRGSDGKYPQPDWQWIEDRFWIWVHYGATKIGRGELFEAIDFVGYLRARVLGPLLLARAGHQSNGLRRIEQLLPEDAVALERTLCGHDPVSCGRALGFVIELYRGLREGAQLPTPPRRIGPSIAQSGPP